MTLSSCVGSDSEQQTTAHSVSVCPCHSVWGRPLLYSFITITIAITIITIAIAIFAIY